MAKQLINGKVFDWSSVTINVSGAENIEITEISYDDEQDAELNYGRGGKPRGFGTGNLKNSVKVSMLREDFNELCKVMKASGCNNFYSYVFDKITVAFADDGAETSVDVLTKVKFNKRGFKNASGDKSIKVDLDGFAVGGIKINGLEA